MLPPESDASACFVVDALSLGRNEAHKRYEFRERRFQRLTGILVSDRPSLDVRLRFSVKQGQAMLRGDLAGTVELICQRCLKCMPYLLDEHFTLLVSETGLLAERENADELDEEYQSSEFEEWFADATRLDISELVEEQVILALPLIAKHEDLQHCEVSAKLPADVSRDVQVEAGTVESSMDAGNKSARRPFANLRELLNK